MDREQWEKIGRGALVAGAGAFLTYLAEAIPGVDFGQYTPLVVAMLSIFVNYARKRLSSLEF